MRNEVRLNWNDDKKIILEVDKMTQSNILYPQLDTPAVLMDLDKLEANAKEMVHTATDAGVKLRPHTKVHECVDIAKLQIESGACGISVAKVAEAERMVEGGIEDIMIVHPFYGDHKLEAVKRLLSRPKFKLSIVVDMVEQAEGLSQVGQAVDKKIPVLLKIDSNGRRFGCPPGEPTLKLAKELCQLPGIKFTGIMTHGQAGEQRTADEVDRLAFEFLSLMAGEARMLKREGIPINDVCLGSSPTFHPECRYIKKNFPEITELHPGACLVGDIEYMNAFATTEDKCAASVLTTVVSTHHAPDRAVIDAGVKTFSPEALSHLQWKPDYFFGGRPRYGLVKGRPDLWLGWLCAAVGVIYLMDANKKVNIGERLEIVPNNACYTISLHDEIYGVRHGKVERVIPVTGRGKGN